MVKIKPEWQLDFVVTVVFFPVGMRGKCRGDRVQSSVSARDRRRDECTSVRKVAHIYSTIEKDLFE